MYGKENKNLAELCSYLHEQGKNPRKSSLGWDRATIRRILRNRTYIGLAGFGKTEKCIGDMQRIIHAPKSGRIQASRFARNNCPEETWISIPVPAIVPEGLYLTVQEKLNKAQKFASRNTKKPSILQGILICSECGSTYYKKARTNKYTYYCCSSNFKKKEKNCVNRSIRQSELDEYIWNWVISMLQNPELIQTELKRRANDEIDNRKLAEKKAFINREKNKTISSRDKLLDAYTESDCISLEELKKRMSLLNQKLYSLERELNVIENQTANKEIIQQGQLTIVKFAESLGSSSEMLAVEEKQRVIRALIDEIVIHKDSIKIKHCIPLSGDSMQKSEKCLLKEKRSFGASPLYVLLPLLVDEKKYFNDWSPEFARELLEKELRLV